MSDQDSMSDLVEKIFIELLSSYHDGIGVSHSAHPQGEVSHSLAREAYFMAKEFKATIKAVEDDNE